MVRIGLSGSIGAGSVADFMGKYNKERFKSIIIYMDDYHRLEKLRQTDKEPMAQVVHHVLEPKSKPVRELKSDTMHPIIEPKSIKENKPSIIAEQPSSIIGKDTKDVPKEVREWYERWKKQGTNVYRFTSTCQAMMKCSEEQAQEWFERLK